MSRLTFHRPFSSFPRMRKQHAGYLRMYATPVADRAIRSFKMALSTRARRLFLSRPFLIRYNHLEVSPIVY